MRNKFKIIIAAAAAIVSLVLLTYAFSFFTRPSSMLAYLPGAPDLKQYVLAETRENNFPTRLSAFLTDGPFALLHRQSSASVLLSLAPAASDAAVMIVNDGLGGAGVCAAYKLPASLSSKLGKGKLPEEWLNILSSAKIEKGREKDSWEIWSAKMDAPIYYYTDKENVVMASDRETFAQLTELRSSKGGRRKHVWQQERSWPGHIEFGDGAVLLSGETPLKMQFAWRPLDDKGGKTPAGEAKWTVIGLKNSTKAGLLLSAKPTQWDTSEYTIPTEPILVSALNIPKLKGKPETWPFPLSMAAHLTNLLGLSKNSISEVASGKTVFSLGGSNKLLWLTLPGCLAQFSGKESVMRELVASFWENFFFDSEPKKLDGWAYGGTISSPFSVIGAGRGETALLGMMSADSLQSGAVLASYIPKKDKSIGWVVVDLPKLGESMGDMTKMMSLLTFEDGGDDSDPEYPDYAPRRQTELDYGISNSFRTALAGFGRAVAVWERPTSGRLTWYK